MCKKYFDIFNKFIACTKKYYFFHFLVLFFLPFTLIFTISLLTSPLQVIEQMSYDGLALSLNFAIFMYYIFVIIITIAAAALATLFKSLFTHTTTVSSKFLLNNKYYNILYIYTLFIVLLIGLWIFK